MTTIYQSIKWSSDISAAPKGETVVNKRTGVWEKIEAFLAAQTVMQSWHTLTFSRDQFAREVALDALETESLPIPEWLKEQLEKAA